MKDIGPPTATRAGSALWTIAYLSSKNEGRTHETQRGDDGCATCFQGPAPRRTGQGRLVPRWPRYALTRQLSEKTTFQRCDGSLTPPSTRLPHGVPEDVVPGERKFIKKRSLEDKLRAYGIAET